MTLLFRQEVIESKKFQLIGDIVVVPPIRYSIIVAVLVSVTTAIMITLIFSHWNKTETVSGYIAPRGGLIQLYASHGGIVLDVKIKEGDRVVKGQALIELSTETISAGGPVEQMMRAETEHRIDEIDHQIAAEETHFQSDERRLRAKTQALQSQSRAIDAKLLAERQHLDLTRDDVVRYQSLTQQGNGSQLELSRRQQASLVQEVTVKELERQREELGSSLTDVSYELAVLPTERESRISQLRNDRSTLSQAAIQLNANQRYVVSSPVDGQIATLQADLGQSIAPNTPLAALVQSDARLEVLFGVE